MWTIISISFLKENENTVKVFLEDLENQIEDKKYFIIKKRNEDSARVHFHVCIDKDVDVNEIKKLEAITIEKWDSSNFKNIIEYFIR